MRAQGCAAAALLAIATGFGPVLPAAEPLHPADTGARVYARTCSVCHGEDGAGAMWTQESLRRPPRNFRSAASKSELTTARIRTAVTHGVPGTAMMGFASQLSPAEITAVVRHIETEFLGRTAMGPAPPSAGAFPDGLRGDYEWGRRFYLGNCATCHGARGGGDGPRAYFIRPAPRNFLDPAARSTLTRAALFSLVSAGRIGTEMPAWRQVLSPQEIASVCEFVYREFIEPGAGARE